MLKVAFGLCLGLAVGWSAFALGPHAEAYREAPANFPIERWRPGLTLDEVRERAARERLRLRRDHADGRVVVHRLEDDVAGWVGLGFCRERLLFVRHVLRLASTLQAVEYVHRIAGRPTEAAAAVGFFPDNSLPHGALTLSWRTDDAGMQVTVSAGARGLNLVEMLGEPAAACPV